MNTKLGIAVKNFAYMVGEKIAERPMTTLAWLMLVGAFALGVLFANLQWALAVIALSTLIGGFCIGMIFAKLKAFDRALKLNERNKG